MKLLSSLHLQSVSVRPDERSATPAFPQLFLQTLAIRCTHMLPRNSTSHHRAVTPQHGTRQDRHIHRRGLLPKIVSICSPGIQSESPASDRHSRSSTPAREMRLSMQVRRKCRVHKTPRRSFCRPASHSLEIDAQFRCNVKASSPGMSSSLRVVQFLRDIGRMTKNGHILRRSWS